MFKHLSLHCEIEDQIASIKGSFFYKLRYPCFCSFSKQNSYRLQESWMIQVGHKFIV